VTPYVRVHALDEALEHLSRMPFRIVAGGTDFYPALGDRPLREPVMDVSGIAALRGIARDGAWFRIGALTTWTDVIRADLPAWFDGLKLAAREVGSVQIQNAATVAGNICNASPAADGTVALMAMDAQVEVTGAGGARVLPLGEFVLGPRKTALGPGEMVTAVLVPAVEERGASDFLKLGARHYLIISIAMVGAVVHADETGRVTRAGIAVGSCSPVARRIDRLERKLLGRRAGEGLADLAEPEDLDVLAPIDDVRATGEYRRDAALTLLRRTLARCEEALR